MDIYKCIACILFFIFIGCSLRNEDSYTYQTDQESELKIFNETSEYHKMNISPRGCSIRLNVGSEYSSETSKFQWYKIDNNNDSTTIVGATNKYFDTEKFSSKGIQCYLCNIKTYSSEGELLIEKNIPFFIAYTGLPTIVIETPSNAIISSKTEWLNNSCISVISEQNKSSLFKIQTSIKGRGNTSWTLPKKPYTLKLEEKHEILGMPKNKRWNLIANYYDNSFCRNEIAFYLSRCFELDYTVKGRFVDLVLNGDYKGLYWIGESIKVDKNRININDKKDFLIEMDIYYDEIWKFKSPIKEFPYMIKNDDYMTTDKLELVENFVSNLEMLLYPNYNNYDAMPPDENYSRFLDLKSWAKFWIINEILDNGELNHPKSCFFTLSDNLIKAGPVWDFDYAGYYKTDCRVNTSLYYDALFQSPSFNSTCKQIWDKYKETIEVRTALNNLKEIISIAYDYDKLLWGIHPDARGYKYNSLDDAIDFFADVIEYKYNIVNEEILQLE